MSPTVTIFVTTGSDSANHGSFSTIGVSKLIAFSPTWWATTVEPNGFDSDASWNTVSGLTSFAGLATVSPLRRSLTPKPFAYTVLPPCTTATAIPGRPDFFIRSLIMPSSLATAFSTALSGNGIAGTSGGGTSKAVGPADGCGCSAGFEAQPDISTTTAATAVSGRNNLGGITPAR